MYGKSITYKIIIVSVYTNNVKLGKEVLIVLSRNVSYVVNTAACFLNNRFVNLYLNRGMFENCSILPKFLYKELFTNCSNFIPS